jgi:DNA-binding CsgD family transcriptional regulator
MTDEEFRKILLKKLDLNNRLQALNLIKDKQSLKEKIESLSSLGFGPSEIADITRTSQNYVNVALSRIRKTQKKGDDIEDKEGDLPAEAKNSE